MSLSASSTTKTRPTTSVVDSDTPSTTPDSVMAVDPDSSRRARVLLVDDHEIVRSGLRYLIEMEEGFVVTGEAGTADEAISLVQADSPDVVIMDVRLPDRSGISACQEITRRFPEVKVLILTAYADDFALSSAVAAGASGYLLKRVVVTELMDDVRRVLAGQFVFDRERDFDTPEPARRLARLSPQERVLAGHLADGLTNGQIADRMGLSEKTVKNYASNVLTKLGVARRSEAAAFMARLQTVQGSMSGEGLGRLQGR